VADAELAAIWRLLVGDHAEQRRLAGAVRTDDADNAAGRQPEIQILDQEVVAKSFPDMRRLDDEIAEPRPRWQDDLRRVGSLLAALRDERVIVRDARLALRLAGARALPHPFKFALLGATARLFLPALGFERGLLLLEPAGIIDLLGDAAATLQREAP